MQAGGLTIDFADAFFRHSDELEEFRHRIHSVRGKKELIEDKSALCAADKVDRLVARRFHQRKVAVPRSDNGGSMVGSYLVDLPCCRDWNGNGLHRRICQKGKLCHKRKQPVAVYVVSVFIDAKDLLRSGIQHHPDIVLK